MSKENCVIEHFLNPRIKYIKSTTAKIHLNESCIPSTICLLSHNISGTYVGKKSRSYLGISHCHHVGVINGKKLKAQDGRVLYWYDVHRSFIKLYQLLQTLCEI